MATVKTAVSIERALFDQAEGMARRLKVSRSRFFALALEDFLSKEKNRALLDKINRACSEPDEGAEQELRRRSRRTHRTVVEGTW